jgi:hypothetical protein
MGIAKIENGEVVHIDRTTDEAPEGWLVVGPEIVCGMLWDGNSFTAPPTPDPTVPKAVTPRQARLALLGAGLLDAVESAIEAGSAADRITWEYAVDVRRDYPMIANLGTSLGLTSAQIDDLFRTAATL